MRIKRTSACEEDLIQIWLYVGERNKRAADRLLEDIEKRCEILKDYPHAGAAREDIAPGLRLLVEGSYLILYRVAEGEVEIIRVLHARRKLSPDIL